jgi:hypothetical protein
VLSGGGPVPWRMALHLGGDCQICRAVKKFASLPRWGGHTGYRRQCSIQFQPKRRQMHSTTGTKQRRSGEDRRSEDCGPPSGWRERRRNVERRRPEVREISFSEWVIHMRAKVAQSE